MTSSSTSSWRFFLEVTLGVILGLVHKITLYVVIGDVLDVILDVVLEVFFDVVLEAFFDVVLKVVFEVDLEVVLRPDHTSGDGARGRRCRSAPPVSTSGSGGAGFPALSSCVLR